MFTMSLFVPSESILDLRMRTLRNKATPMRGRPSKSDCEDVDTSPLVSLYSRHRGDLDAIFTELGEDPGKAKKYPPLDAEDFAVWLSMTVKIFSFFTQM